MIPSTSFDADTFPNVDSELSLLFAKIIQKNKVFQKVHLKQEMMSTSDK